MLQAQAQAGIVRADQFPTVQAGVNSAAIVSRVLEVGSRGDRRGAGGRGRCVGLDFRKFRRATEAACQVLVSEWGRRAVVTSLKSRGGRISSGPSTWNSYRDANGCVAPRISSPDRAAHREARHRCWMCGEVASSSAPPRIANLELHRAAGEFHQHAVGGQSGSAARPIAADQPHAQKCRGLAIAPERRPDIARPSSNSCGECRHRRGKGRLFPGSADHGGFRRGLSSCSRVQPIVR